MLGFDALIFMQLKFTVDGVELTEEDIRRLLAQTEGLAFLKGKWVENLWSLFDFLNKGLMGDIHRIWTVYEAS